MTLEDLARAIARQEGFLVRNSRAQRNNNPGNIWDGTGKGKPRRVWPSIPIDDKGFLIFPSPAQGIAYLLRQIAVNVAAGLTLREFVAKWAPPNENDTEAYVKFVSAFVKVPADGKLWDYVMVF